jgi:hypothetical protein
MARVEVVEIQGVVQTGGEPGAGTVTLGTLGSDVLALISGGSGATTIADGADVAQGAKADSEWDGSAASPTIMGVLKRAANKVAALGAIGDAAWTTGNGTVVAVLKAIAGSNSTVAGAISSARMNSNIQRTGAATALTIAISTTDSGALDISTTIAGGFVIPSAFTGTSVTYKASQTTSGHQPLYDQYGNLVTTPVAANRSYPFPQEAAGFNSLILVSSASEAAARTINTYKKG